MSARRDFYEILGVPRIEVPPKGFNPSDCNGIEASAGKTPLPVELEIRGT